MGLSSEAYKMKDNGMLHINATLFVRNLTIRILTQNRQSSEVYLMKMTMSRHRSILRRNPTLMKLEYGCESINENISGMGDV